MAKITQKELKSFEKRGEKILTGFDKYWDKKERKENRRAEKEMAKDFKI